MELLRYYIENESGKAEKVAVTDADVRSFMADQNKQNELAGFIHDRLFHRYINPFLYKAKEKIKKEGTNEEIDKYSLLYKNGFSIMANSCLLIETLEAFYRGWENTHNKSESAFLKFFTRDSNFTEFSTTDIPTQFYKNIRCGILHQGETTGGWKLTRGKDSVLLDKDNKTINATKFMDKMKKSIGDYKDELLIADWNFEIWVNARKKVKAILKNTQK